MKTILVILGALVILLAGITLGLWVFGIPIFSEVGFIAYFFPSVAFIIPHIIARID